MHYAYPATLETGTGRTGDGLLEGLPGATWGVTPAEALSHAKDLLTTALEMPIEDGEPIPEPPPGNGRPIVETELSR